MAEQLHKWQEEFALKDELLQGDFDAIEIALFRMPGLAITSRHADLSVVHGSWLRAAIEAGWIASPKCRALVDDKNGERAYFYDGTDVDEMHPAKVNWLGKRIVERHDRIIKEDPKN